MDNNNNGNKKDNVIKILLVVVLVLFIALIIIKLLGKKDVPNENNQPIPNNAPVISDYTGVYSANNNEVQYVLYLRSDNTFRLSINGETPTNHVGNYEVTNNVITLRTKVLCESNGCYFKEGSKLNADLFNPINVSTSNNGLLDLVYSGQSLSLLKSNDLSENAEDISTYSISPIDSEDAMYTDCTDKDKI